MEGAFQHRETPPLCNPKPGVQPQKLVLSMEMKEWQVELLLSALSNCSYFLVKEKEGEGG